MTRDQVNYQYVPGREHSLRKADLRYTLDDEFEKHGIGAKLLIAGPVLLESHGHGQAAKMDRQAPEEYQPVT